MKVMVDTRHDSLEEALATVRAAFGSSTTKPTADRVAGKNTTSPAGVRPAKRAKSRRATAAAPGTKRSPGKGSAKQAVTAGQAAPGLDVSAVPAKDTYVAAPSADPAGQRVPAKKSTKRTLKAAPVAKAAVSKSAGKRAPAKKQSVRNGAKSPKSINQTSNIAPPGEADAIRAWARTQGMEVKQAGRLPAAVINAYQEWPDHV